MTQNSSEAPVHGGCQCGAVRYRITAPLRNPHICHCRMCQKAFGSFFAPLVAAPREAFFVTRGDLAFFMSSDQAERGFCRDCGTPLTFAYVTSDHIAVSIGSLDEPNAVIPRNQYGTEARVAYFSELPGLPGEKTGSDDPNQLAEIAASNHQHPDHETEHWRPHLGAHAKS